MFTFNDKAFTEFLLLLIGSKATPYEGGTKVPGLIIDLSNDQRFLPRSGPTTSSVREFHGLMHFSDWLPTLLGFAGVDKSKYPNKIDGLDISQSLKQSETNPSESPRDEVLLEMYYPEEFLFKQGLVSYRIGDYKLIKGIVRDSNYYRESYLDHLNISGASLLTRFTENLNRLGDYIYGNNRFDGLRISITHAIMQDVMTHDQHIGKEETNRLYNIKTDPYESINLYFEPWAKPIIEKIESRLNHYNATRPKPQKAYIQSHLVNNWPKTLVPGDCSMNLHLHSEECRFTHPWVADVSLLFKSKYHLFLSHYPSSLTTHSLAGCRSMATTRVDRFDGLPPWSHSRCVREACYSTTVYCCFSILHVSMGQTLSQRKERVL